MHHPLNLAVTAMWTLGGLYFSAGALVAWYALAYHGLTARSACVAALALVPGTAYLFAASAARRGSGLVLIASSVCTALLGVALLILLGLVVIHIGVMDLLRPRGHAPAAGVLMIFILTAYHFRLVYHLARAYAAGAHPVDRGFIPRPVPPAAPGPGA